jgi:hypothetical protein
MPSKKKATLSQMLKNIISRNSSRKTSKNGLPGKLNKMKKSINKVAYAQLRISRPSKSSSKMSVEKTIRNSLKLLRNKTKKARKWILPWKK